MRRSDAEIGRSRKGGPRTARCRPSLSARLAVIHAEYDMERVDCVHNRCSRATEERVWQVADELVTEILGDADGDQVLCL